MRKIILFLILFLIPLTFSFGAKKPSWIDNWQDTYPESIYLGAVGIGKNRSEAENMAYGSLATFFGVNIDSTSCIGAEDDGYGNGVTNYSSQTVMNVNVSDIVGIKIADYWEDKNCCYALAILDKNVAIHYYYAEATEYALKIAYYFSIEPESLAFGSVGAVQNLKSYVDEYDRSKKILSVLSPLVAEELISIPETSEIMNLIEEYTGLLSVRVQDGSSDWERISANVVDAMYSAGISVTDRSSRYILIDILDLTETTLEGNPLKFVKYSLTLKIFDEETKTYVFTWSASGREGQTSFSAAKERAFVAMNKKIKNGLGVALAEAFGFE